MKYLGFLLIFTASSLFAETAFIEWETPTQRKDLTPVIGTIDFLLYKNDQNIHTTDNNNHSLEVVAGDLVCLEPRETTGTVVTIGKRDCETIPATLDDVEIQIKLIKSITIGGE